MLANVEEVACAPNLLNKGRIHYVFHISCLKKQLGSKVVPQTKMLELDEEGQTKFELEGILQIQTKDLRK